MLANASVILGALPTAAPEVPSAVATAQERSPAWTREPVPPVLTEAEEGLMIGRQAVPPVPAPPVLVPPGAMEGFGRRPPAPVAGVAKAAAFFDEEARRLMMQNVTVRLARPGSPPAALPVDGLATGTADTWVLQPAAAPPLLDQLRSAEAAPTVPAEAPAANPWILPAMSHTAKAAFRALSVTAEHLKRRRENTDACIARALADYEE